MFEEWEADFGRTFVLGPDPVKLKLRDDIGKAFLQGKKYFNEHPDVTAVELYRQAQKLARDFGWEYGGSIAGHLIGPTSESPAIKSRCMFTPTIRTGCETWAQKVRNATGFSRFIS